MKIRTRIDTASEIGRISPEIYGQFSEHLGRCIYDGIYVGEDSSIPNTNGMRNDVVKALKDINIPVLRWPGGCFADEYHWRDGIGPKDERRRMVNTNWGGIVEDNSFGTHEFFELCRQLECEPYIALNLGSGTVTEAAEWIEYMTAPGESTIALERAKNGHKEPWKLKYIGIGNENWGCGGSMTPEYYASEYRRYQSFCKNYGDNTLYKVACGPNADDYNWTEKFMTNIDPDWHANAISLHYYTLPGDWNNKGSATVFSDSEYYTTIRKTLYIEEIINCHLSIMEKYDPAHKVSLIVDEWGTWYDVEPGTNPGFLYQQNTMRDAIIAAINLNIFNTHCDRIVMANIAQVVNVLQAMLLTEGMSVVKTPTYHIFDMYKEHQGAQAVACYYDNFMHSYESSNVPVISASASVRTHDGGKQLIYTVSNASLEEAADVEITLENAVFVKNAIITVLKADNVRAYNTFDEPDAVTPDTTTAIFTGNTATLKVPAGSVIRVVADID